MNLGQKGEDNFQLSTRAKYRLRRWLRKITKGLIYKYNRV